MIGPFTGQISPLEDVPFPPEPLRALVRPDLGRDGGARRLHLRKILFVALALRANGHEEALLVRARGRQGVLAHDESVAGGALLLGLAREDGGRLGHVALRRGRHHAGEAHLA